MAVKQTLQSGSRERRLYLWSAIGLLLLVLLGFARTYYLKGFFDTPSLSGLVHFHGIVMTLWVVLFVTQVGLIAARRTKIHRRLGVVGAVWAVVVLVVGIVTSIVAARKGVGGNMPPLIFMVVPLGDMVVFAVLVGTGLYFRRNKETHKRLMLLSCGTFLPAAVGRIPLTFFETGGPLVFYGIPDLLLLLLVSYDTIRQRKLHPAFGWGLLFLVASHPLRLMLAETQLWMRFAIWLTG